MPIAPSSAGETPIPRSSVYKNTIPFQFANGTYIEVSPPTTLRPFLDQHRAEDVAARAATEAGVVLGAQLLQRHKLLGPAPGAYDRQTRRR